MALGKQAALRMCLLAAVTYGVPCHRAWLCGAILPCHMADLAFKLISAPLPFFFSSFPETKRKACLRLVQKAPVG